MNIPFLLLKDITAKYADEIYRNDICGDIVVLCDGKTFNVVYDNQ